MRRLSLLLAFAVPVAVAAEAAAQSRTGGSTGSTRSSGNLFGGMGPTGQRTSSGTRTVGGPSMGGSTGLGGLSGGTGGLGSGGGTGLGTGTNGGSSIDGQFGQLGATIGNNAFVGQGDTTGRQVGNRLSGQSAVGGTSFGPNGLTPSFNRGLGLDRNALGPNGGGTAAESRLTARPVQRIAFEYPQAAAPQVAARLGTLIDRRPGLAGVTVVEAGSGRFVLRGTVASDDARSLAVNVLRLEPGVREIVDELTVAGAAP